MSKLNFIFNQLYFPNSMFYAQFLPIISIILIIFGLMEIERLLTFCARIKRQRGEGLLTYVEVYREVHSSLLWGIIKVQSPQVSRQGFIFFKKGKTHSWNIESDTVSDIL